MNRNLSNVLITRMLCVVCCLCFWPDAIAQFHNLKLADLTETTSAGGVSIAIDKKNVKNLIAGYGTNRLLNSRDGGKTWNEIILESEFGAGGDPILVSDAKGDFHYFHLPGQTQGDEGSFDRIVGHMATDDLEGNTTWSKGASIGNHPPKQQANPRAAGLIDQSGLYLTWTEFDHYGSSDSTCKANILFSKSAHGKRWSDPVVINQVAGNCLNGDQTPSGAIASVNPEGRVFLVWANHGEIYMDRSYTDGDKWLSSDMTIGQQPGGSWMSIPGMGVVSGMPTLLIDNSQTFFRGSLYVSFADQRNGEKDTDIWLIRSTNRGDTWTLPQRINKDPAGKHQFMPMMTMDQATGVIYMVYYDRRAYDDDRTDVYLAYSLDGSNHFSEVKISDTPFMPAASKAFVRYLGITAHKGIIAPIWTRMDDGKLSVWTSVIKQEELFKKEELPRIQPIRRPSSGAH